MRLAIDNTDTKGPLAVAHLPDVKKTATGGFRQAQPLTQRNLVVVLGHFGWAVRFDVLRHRVVFSLGGVGIPEADEPGQYQALCDALVRLDIVALGRLDELLLAVALEARFHPFEDWLLGLEAWDGVDRLGALAGSVTTDNPLWGVYLENWLVQVVQGACGWRSPVKDGLPHVLVLVGAQGVGKTRWFRALGHGWIKTEAELHLSSSSGKDHQIEVLQWPMVELAELNGIFRKSDIEHLKSFLSRPEDSLRAPYARRALAKPRMTCFCGSVNDAEFLVDSSGSRRFWPVMVSGIDWGFSVDWPQLWAQVLSYWGEDAGFGLTREEDAQRVVIAEGVHTQVGGEIETLAGYWDAHRDKLDTYRPMNITEILNMLGFRHASPKVRAIARQFMVSAVGPQRRISNKQRCWEFPFSALAHDSCFWS